MSKYKIIDKLRKVAQNERKVIYLNGKPSRYEVSSNGEIISHYFSNEKILKPHLLKNGYCIVCLCDDDGKRYWKLVHRLVAEYFIPIPNNLVDQGYTMDTLEVNHIDGTSLGKQNNSVFNLEWTTSSGNKYHAYRTGLKGDAEDHPEAIYSNEQIEMACKLLSENAVGVREVAKITNVDYSTLQQILLGVQWKRISKKYDFSTRKKKHILYDNSTKDYVMKLLSQNQNKPEAEKLSCSQIGKITGMSRTSVWYMWNKYFNDTTSSTTRES